MVISGWDMNQCSMLYEVILAVVAERKCACYNSFNPGVSQPRIKEEVTGNMGKLGCGPQHREFQKEILQAM